MGNPEDLIGDLVRSATRVLDVGCGAHPVPAATVAVDLDRLTLLAVDGPARVVGDAARLPFAPASFDALVVRGVLHHLADVNAAVGQACTVLRPQGLLLIVEGLPMPEDEFAVMSRELATAGVAGEPRNGIQQSEILAAGAALGCTKADVIGAVQHERRQHLEYLPLSS